MFRECIKKINDFIQWTKKSYFWHPIISLNLGFVLFNTIYSLITSGWDETWTFPGMDVKPVPLLQGLSDFIFCLFLFAIFTIPFAILIKIVAKIIYFILIRANIIKKQPCCITNKFLLYNRWYNTYYITSFILLSFSFILFFVSSIISFFLSL